MDVTDKPAMDDLAGYEFSPDTDSWDIESKKSSSTQSDQLWMRLRNFINERCIDRVPEGSKELPSIVPGGFYVWQFYLRTAILEPEFLDYIAASFWNSFAPRFRSSPFQLAGLESASVPIITAVLLSGRVWDCSPTAFTVRKEFKEYGRGNIIEGEPNNLPVVFIDDLTSPRHRAFWKVARAIRRIGLKFHPHGFVLVRKQLREEVPVIRTSIGTVNIESLFTLDDFSLDHDEFYYR